jgi:signal transduction histidine kinase
MDSTHDAPRAGDPARTTIDGGDAHDVADAHWSALFAQVGAEVAQPLTAALEHLRALTDAPGRDPVALQALTREIERARAAALLAQQLARLANPALQRRPEQLDLALVLREVVAERQPAARRRGTPLLETIRPAAVVVDPPLLHRLLHATLDWALAHTRSALHIGLDHRSWPARARLHVRFRHRPTDEVPDPQAPMHLVLERADTACGCRLTVEFPRTVYAPIEGISTLELDTGFNSTFGSRPLAGHHVLVVTARRDLRQEIRDALRPLGLMIDFVGSVEGAREFCQAGPPHVLVHDAQLAGERLRALHADLRTLAHPPVFVEVADDGPRLNTSPFDAGGIARVGRATLADALPAALMFELSQDAPPPLSDRTPA